MKKNAIFIWMFLSLINVGCGGSSTSGETDSSSSNTTTSSNTTSTNTATVTTFWPISGATSLDYLADSYGPRILSGNYDFHRGIDVRQKNGVNMAEGSEPVYVPIPGVVLRVEETQAGDTLERFGKFVVVSHTQYLNKKAQTAYLHLYSTEVVVGQSVQAGDVLGYVGKSGVNINTVHLHFEYYEGLDSGLIQRIYSKSPLTLLPYIAKNITINATRKNDNLLNVELIQLRESMDIVRIEVSNAMKTINFALDFESREGMDSNDDDTNPYQNIHIIPDDLATSDTHYTLNIEFTANWKNENQVEIIVTRANGEQKTQTISL